MTVTTDPARETLLDAILPHVAFDGWSEAAFRAAARDAEMELREARAVAPRGAVDLASDFHRRGDRQMAEALRAERLDDMRFRNKVARALRVRLDVAGDREAVRRASALFALPVHAAEGARLIWGTADAVWEALGDPSDDINWYTKRATLSGVWTSVVLYWMGDDSVDQQATDAFIDRRIEDVMRIEKMKARVNGNPILRPFVKPFEHLGGMVRPPARMPPVDLPGHWSTGE
ncbi:COQ9 family protein [Histidinibacterium aquaticum]|uniref:COQ9 family protein n=1 Tax=Histidinibacterium aquaticum TaxID=2613962 RepID=A0A5J5GAZ5_9RHOB|nr:COQ9 family protein [Histidinibacterium aquaticum]KAA9005277.1 COQ9 family protein [Histidinibacterium aquaticum]